MAGKFGDYNTAVRIKRVVEMLATNLINELRPLPRYGVTTSSVNAMTLQVQVRLGKETSSIPATCSPFLKPTIGSTVRVEGQDSDLFVSAVMNGGLA